MANTNLESRIGPGKIGAAVGEVEEIFRILPMSSVQQKHAG